jgi:hypothetical protein
MNDEASLFSVGEALLFILSDACPDASDLLLPASFPLMINPNALLRKPENQI